MALPTVTLRVHVLYEGECVWVCNWLSRHPHFPHPATGGVGSAMTPPSPGPPPKTVDRSVQMSLGTHTGKEQDTLGLGLGQAAQAMYASSPEKAHPTQGGADQPHARRVLARDPGNQGPRPCSRTHPEEANPPPQAPHTPRPLESTNPSPPPTEAETQVQFSQFSSSQGATRAQ